jgi:methyl-accepting chemotaxis protein
MGKSENDQKSTVRRLGMTRFIVPHDSFDWYTRGIAITTLATGSLLAGATWIYHQQLFNAMGLRDVAEHPEVLDQYARLSLMSTGVVVLVASLYITMMAGFLFHRVAGPIYRLRQHMLTVARGEPVEALSLRAKDQLGDLCDAYNQLLQSQDLIEPKPLEEASPSVQEQS